MTFCVVLLVAPSGSFVWSGAIRCHTSLADSPPVSGTGGWVKRIKGTYLPQTGVRLVSWAKELERGHWPLHVPHITHPSPLIVSVTRLGDQLLRGTPVYVQKGPPWVHPKSRGRERGWKEEGCREYPEGDDALPSTTRSLCKNRRSMSFESFRFSEIKCKELSGGFFLHVYD